MRRSQIAIVGALIALCVAPATYAAATIGNYPTRALPVASAIEGGATTLASQAARAASPRPRKRPTAPRPSRPSHPSSSAPRAGGRTARTAPAEPAVPAASSPRPPDTPATSGTPGTPGTPGTIGPKPPPSHAQPTPSPPSSPRVTPSATPTSATPGITRSGSTLLLDGRPWKFTGVNNYGAATDYAVNYGCGSPTADLDQMFNALRPGSVVRFWAFQALGWNNKASPGQIDFTGIDRVIHTADADHQHLIVTLSDQAGVCDDGHWHDQAWYDGGYADPRSDDDGRGLGNLSYKDWVTAVVTRYRDDPSIAFWEPVNEPQDADCSGATGSGCYNSADLTCPDGSAESIENFFTAIGQQIRAIDPGALISLGDQGGGQCGITGTDLDIVDQSPGIDLLTYHDYDGDTNTFSGGLQERLQQAAAVNKPLAVEEAGFTGGTSSGCGSQATRAANVTNKIDAAFSHGAVGYAPWWYSASPSDCGQDFGPNDPVMQSLRNAPTS